MNFNGMGIHLGNLSRLSNAITRSISAENPTGEKGQGGKATEGTGAASARELGQGWKISPSINIAGNQDSYLSRYRRIGSDSAYLADGAPISLAAV